MPTILEPEYFYLVNSLMLPDAFESKVSKDSTLFFRIGATALISS